MKTDEDLKKLALLMARKWGARGAIERFRYMATGNQISRATSLKLIAICEADVKARLTEWELTKTQTGAGQ